MAPGQVVTIKTDEDTDTKLLTIPRGRRNVGSTSSADTLISEGECRLSCMYF